MLNVDGLDIYFKHVPDEWGFTTSLVKGREVSTPYKGVTTCFVKRGEELVVESSAFCSHSDRFSKEVGRKVSLTKSLKNFDKDFRKKVWEEYFKIVGKK